MTRLKPRSWRRSGLTLLLAAPWSAYSLLLTMHGGGVIALHLLWMLVLVGILTVLAIAGALSALVSSRYDTDLADID